MEEFSKISKDLDFLIERAAAITKYEPIDICLFEIFHYAILGGLEESKGKAFIKDIALLFDQLIALVAAASTLHQAGGASESDLDLVAGSCRELKNVPANDARPVSRKLAEGLEHE